MQYPITLANLTSQNLESSPGFNSIGSYYSLSGFLGSGSPATCSLNSFPIHTWRSITPLVLSTGEPLSYAEHCQVQIPIWSEDCPATFSAKFVCFCFFEAEISHAFLKMNFVLIHFLYSIPNQIYFITFITHLGFNFKVPIKVTIFPQTVNFVIFLPNCSLFFSVDTHESDNHMAWLITS